MLLENNREYFAKFLVFMKYFMKISNTEKMQQFFFLGAAKVQPLLVRKKKQIRIWV